MVHETSEASAHDGPGFIGRSVADDPANLWEKLQARPPARKKPSVDLSKDAASHINPSAPRC